jgi:glycogen debranching enzyme
VTTLGFDPDEDLLVGDRYYILASALSADVPKFVLKHDDAFLVADRRGDFPRLPGGEFGLYVDGTRFLQLLELRIQEQRPLVLNASASEDTLQIAVELTNPDVRVGGGVGLLGHTIRITRQLTLYRTQLSQTLTVENFSGAPQELSLRWSFAADFVDVFEVRGFARGRRGTPLAPECEDSVVRLGYQGLDGVRRTTHLTFVPAPSELNGTTARYRITLPPGADAELSVTIVATLRDVAPPAGIGSGEVLARRRAVNEQLDRGVARLESSHGSLNRWIERARTDLNMLVTQTADGPMPYAGIPWYVAPFGRDSLITALQVLPFQPDMARGTLRFLARHQGTIDDVFTDQEPGKILHEYRSGELAACREIVFIPYYGSVDATPLFVILLGEYLRWTGDEEFVRGLWPALERALEWMLGPGAMAGDGYLRYQRRSPHGLDNQGWKDARDAVMHASGALALGPIALVEAQGYQYAALQHAAWLVEAVGKLATGPDLRQRARRLAEQFERDFWLAAEGHYALALDGGDRPCRVITSNPGHCLWMGLVRASRAESVAKRLMAPDMFSGWGLRTLAAGEQRYNPMSYHNGSVWPHDTAIAAVGLRRYGLTDGFVSLFTALLDAVLQFDGLRMPELLCGFPRVQGYGPTRYPVACSPQAWSAGIVFQLLTAMLGLEPDAGANRITLNQPILPPWLDWVMLQGLRLRSSSLDLMVSRGRQGAAVELLARSGDAELIVRR